MSWHPSPSSSILSNLFRAHVQISPRLQGFVGNQCLALVMGNTLSLCMVYTTYSLGR